MHTAMILSAGRGIRLRPLTNQIPKPLCSIHGKALIEYHIENLVQAGFSRIIINHAYLGGLIRQKVGNGQRWHIEIHYSPEPPGGLETGGGIVNALPLLGQEPFLVINADIFTDYQYTPAILSDDALAHLVLVEKRPFYKQGDFGLSATQRLMNHNRDYLFAGIACYHPKLFQNYHIGRYSLTPILRELVEKQRATGEMYKGAWFDTGTLEQLEYANKATSSLSGQHIA